MESPWLAAKVFNVGMDLNLSKHKLEKDQCRRFLSNSDGIALASC